MGRIIILSFFYAIILVATTSPMETTSTSSDEQPSITFLVQDTEYMLTQEEASQFKTLKNMIEAEALETPQEAIPLPNLITSKTFDYILKDLKEIPYDHQLISDKQLIALINAINYLDNQDLLTLYLNRLADRLSALDSQEKLEYFQRLLNDRLPAEIQDLLSALINQASMKLFKALPQLSVDDKPLVKRVLERESIFYKKMWLSPDKKYIAFLEKFSGIISLVLIDADTNKELWRKKDFNFSSIKFSSDSSQIVLRKGNYLILIDTQTGEILWEKNKKNSFKIMKLTLDNSLIFLLKKGSKKIIIIDAENGLRVGKFLLENFEAVSRCIYDSELGSLIIQGKEKTQDVIFSINIFTQERLKFKKENHLQVSPDGKKIITLTNSNVTIENSFDDENTFTFNFTKRFNHIPLVSFSRDTDFVALLSYNSDETIIILNMENRNSNILPSIKNLAQQLDAFFSPEAKFLMFYTSLYNYTLFNLETKKIQWTKKFEQTEKPQFLSESLLVFTEKPSNLIFCSTQTGNVITSVNLNNKIGYRRKIFITKNNFLYCHHSRTTANRENIACLDVAPLLIFLLIDKKHFSLNNAMIIHLILNALKNRKEITLTEALFDQLPQELSTALKRIIEDHNQELSQGNSQ